MKIIKRLVITTVIILVIGAIAYCAYVYISSRIQYEKFVNCETFFNDVASKCLENTAFRKTVNRHLLNGHKQNCALCNMTIIDDFRKNNKYKWVASSENLSISDFDSMMYQYMKNLDDNLTCFHNDKNNFNYEDLNHQNLRLYSPLTIRQFEE